MLQALEARELTDAYFGAARLEETDESPLDEWKGEPWDCPDTDSET